MKVFLALLLFSVSVFAADYPKSPDLNLTPGVLCQNPNAYRYPERIPYCNRNVSGEQKQRVIRKYDEVDGYHIEDMNRNDFKIDHFIPLSLGGDNDPKNLWPQHKSVWVITDPVDDVAFALLSEGKISQKDAINSSRDAKLHLDRAADILQSLKAKMMY